MGCGISSNKNIQVVSHIYKTCHHRKFPRIKRIKADEKKEYLTRINENCWKKILNFLSYNDLKEIGKTSKSLNKISKHNEVLIKFFKKRIKNSTILTTENTMSYNDKMNEIDSFHNSPKENIQESAICFYRFLRIPSFGNSNQF